MEYLKALSACWGSFSAGDLGLFWALPAPSLYPGFVAMEGKVSRVGKKMHKGNTLQNNMGGKVPKKNYVNNYKK